jgi:hypothetical protein
MRRREDTESLWVRETREFGEGASSLMCTWSIGFRPPKPAEELPGAADFRFAKEFSRSILKRQVDWSLRADRRTRIMKTRRVGKRLASAVLLAATLMTAACGTVTGAAVGAAGGAAIGAGTGYGAGKGALIGTGVGAAAGAIYDITK